MSHAPDTFWDAVDALRAPRGAYRREAYGFVMAALAHAVEALPPERRADPVHRHLSGAELLDSVVALARKEFGPLAPMVFGEWGVHRGEDVGEIVFELVRGGQLSARPEDSPEDFAAADLPGRLRAGREAGGAFPAR